MINTSLANILTSVCRGIVSIQLKQANSTHKGIMNIFIKTKPRKDGKFMATYVFPISNKRFRKILTPEKVQEIQNTEPKEGDNVFYVRRLS